MDPVDDWVDAVTHATSPPELTTVGPDFAVVHEGLEVRRYEGLEPDTDHDIEGFAFRTLPEPGRAAGHLRHGQRRPLRRGGVRAHRRLGRGPGVPEPSPATTRTPRSMNRGAVAEIAALDPDAVVVKGDLTSNGTQSRVRRLPRRLRAGRSATGSPWCGATTRATTGRRSPPSRSRRSPCPGVTLAVHRHLGRRVAGGHRHRRPARAARRAGGPGRPAGPRVRPPPPRRPGLRARRPTAPSASTSTRRRPCSPWSPAGPSIRGYFAGHTHRNRVRRFAATGDVPWVEVACVKDYPGDVGRVPGARGRHRPDRPPHLHRPRRSSGPRRPGTCTPGSTTTTRSARSPTAASPSPTAPSRTSAMADRTFAAADTLAAFRESAPLVALARRRRSTTTSGTSPALGEWSVRELVAHSARAFRTVLEYVEGEVKDPTPHRRPRPSTSGSCWPSRPRTSTSPARAQREAHGAGATGSTPPTRSGPSGRAGGGQASPADADVHLFVGEMAHRASTSPPGWWSWWSTALDLAEAIDIPSPAAGGARPDRARRAARPGRPATTSASILRLLTGRGRARSRWPTCWQ